MPAWAIFLLSLALSAPAAVTIVRGRERTRIERARAFERELSSELLAQASGLDRLVAVLGGLADSLDGDRVLMQAATEAVRLLDATDAVLLTAMADGMSNNEVATRLFISQETVKSHVRHILAKLEADTRTQAVAIALRDAIIA